VAAPTPAQTPTPARTPSTAPRADLCAEDVGAWREAQVRAAMSADAIALFERALEQCPDVAKDRVRAGVAVSLEFETTWAELRKHAKLVALIDARLQALRRNASGDLAGSLTEGGLPVVLGEELLSKSEPAERRRGIEAIARATMWIPERYVKQLAGDTAVVSVNHGDYSTNESLATFAHDWEHGHSKASVSGRIEWANESVVRFESGTYDGMFTLTNALRQVAHNMDAATEDEWWARTRIAWGAWWRLGDRFSRAVQRSQGMEVAFTRGAGPLHVTLTGPVGAKGTLTATAQTGAGTKGPKPVSGKLPLHLIVDVADPRAYDVHADVDVAGRKVEWTSMRVPETNKLDLVVVDPPEPLETAR
jgi:hypothetical protein